MIARAVSILTALTAFGALVLLVVGLPAVLYRFGGSPLPSHVSAWPHIATFLSSRNDGNALLAIIRACTWLAWLLFTACVLAEGQAAIRGCRAPRLRLGGLQGAAAYLVALSAVAFTAPPTVTLAASVTAASPPAAIDAGSQHGAAEEPSRPGQSKDITAENVVRQSASVPTGGWPATAARFSAVRDSRAAPATRLVTVRPGDCLWSLAQRYLGAGDRYPEIVSLNYGQQMEGGQVFRDPSLIEPGWQLLVPVSAILGPSERPTVGHHPGHSTPDQHYRRRHAAAPTQRTETSADHRSQEQRAAEPVFARSAKAGSATGMNDKAATRTSITTGSAGFQASPGADQADSLLTSAAVFIAGALAGAVLTSLGRLRLKQRQHRRRGRRIALPADAEALRTEQRLRAAAPTEQLETLRDALACLGTSVLKSEQQLPDIVGLHVTPDMLEVLLAAPAADAPPAPFVVSPGRQGMCWHLDLPAILALPESQDAPGGGQLADLECHMLPGLITAGSTSDGYLLLDLEAMQVAGCDGPQHLVDRFVTTIATELATGQWSGWYDLILVGCNELSDLRCAEGCPTFDEALDMLATRQATLVHRIADRVPIDVRELRLADPHNEDWGLSVLVSRAEPSAEQMTRLLQLAEDGPGGIAALVAGDPESDDGRMAPSVFQLAPDPERPDGIIANVVPLQIMVRPHALSAHGGVLAPGCASRSAACGIPAGAP